MGPRRLDFFGLFLTQNRAKKSKSLIFFYCLQRFLLDSQRPYFRALFYPGLGQNLVKSQIFVYFAKCFDWIHMQIGF